MLNLNERASDDLIIACSKLIESAALNTPREVMDFFENPWQWKLELKELNIEVQE